MANLHTPERQANESFEDYAERRMLHHAAVAALKAGTLVLNSRHHTHTNQERARRRAFIRNVGGIRQFKRMHSRRARLAV